ncbi:ABC transporter ATP-binding protein [Halorubrum luteum]
MLEVDGITRTYGGLTAVDDVGFTVDAGEIVGVIGPNGAGKTTLFNAITGVDAPDAGRVSLRGEDLTDARPNAACRAGVARTFQSVRTFDESTVRENVLAGALFGGQRRDRDAAARATEKALELVGLATDADRHTSDLPIAARKRVELARALATDPDVLLLDEIGSGLTPVEIDDLTDTIRRIRDERGVAVVWIEHVTDALFRGADRVLVLENGSLIAEGTPAEIRANDRVAEAYLGGGDDDPAADPTLDAPATPDAPATSAEPATTDSAAAADPAVTAAATDGGDPTTADEHATRGDASPPRPDDEATR